MKTICPGLRKFTSGAVLAAFVLALMALAPHAYAENAVDKSANRISKDHWARTEPASPHRVLSSDDDDDDDDTGTASSSSQHSPPSGELNGALHIKSW